MRADVKSIGDFKFPLLGLVCFCLSLSLGPASLPSLEPSFCCVPRLASQPVWYSSGLCPRLLSPHVVNIFRTVVVQTTL